MEQNNLRVFSLHAIIKMQLRMAFVQAIKLIKIICTFYQVLNCFIAK